MKAYSRRRFLSNSLAVGACASMGTLSSKANAARGSANNAIQIGIIGVGGKAQGHIKQLSTMTGVRIVALCDVDPANLARGQSELRKHGVKAKESVDMRHVLDDPDVDAVVVVTPNHWHALASIWACQAGKDVYLEKPVTHNLWEGRKLLEAARKYRCVVQAGTQNRSDDGFEKAIEYLRAGHLGKIRWIHASWYKERKRAGAVAGPQPVPPGVDYDLWTGPAPLKPLMRKRLHYDWHWNWDTGNGDMGNLGGHQMDDAVNILGINSMPKRFLCVGGLFARNDGWETPNVQVAFLEFEGRPPVLVDIRSLPAERDAKYMPHLRGIRRGSIVQCEHGNFAGGRFGGIVYDQEGKKLESFPGDGGLSHMQNWLDAIRTRNHASLKAEIEIGVHSANLCHVANLAYRSGLPTSVDDVLERVGNDDHAMETIHSIATYLRANEVNLKETPLTCSQWMEFNPKEMAFSGGGAHGNAMANALSEPRYRASYAVPDQV